MEFNTTLTLIFVAGVILVYLWDRLNSPANKPKGAVRLGAAKKLQARSPVAIIPGQGSFRVSVVGESNYQADLESICGGRTENGAYEVVEAQLVLEESNPYDPDAVRVDIAGKTIGYLSRENARQYRGQLNEQGYRGVVTKCTATIVGGWDRGGGDKGHFGVTLDIPAKIGN